MHASPATIEGVAPPAASPAVPAASLPQSGDPDLAQAADPYHHPYDDVLAYGDVLAGDRGQPPAPQPPAASHPGVAGKGPPVPAALDELLAWDEPVSAASALDVSPEVLAPAQPDGPARDAVPTQALPTQDVVLAPEVVPGPVEPHDDAFDLRRARQRAVGLLAGLLALGLVIVGAVQLAL